VSFSWVSALELKVLENVTRILVFESTLSCPSTGTVDCTLLVWSQPEARSNAAPRVRRTACLEKGEREKVERSRREQIILWKPPR
jgi:hypothetical protein